MLKILLTTLILTSCGTEAEDWFKQESSPNLPGVNINPVLQPMIDQFLDDAEFYGADTSRSPYLRIAEFGEMPTSNTIGYCTEYAYGEDLSYLEIIIKPTFADKLDTKLYEALMYHELGHCILNLDHSETGIMAPVLGFEQYYQSNWDELVEELFRR